MQTIFDRLEKLRNEKNLTWEHLAGKLELSVSMLMMVRRGERQLSDKALHRLGQVEWAAGIVPPPVPDALTSKQHAQVAPKLDSLRKENERLRKLLAKISNQINTELEPKP